MGSIVLPGPVGDTAITWQESLVMAFPTISGVTYSEEEASNVTSHSVLLPPTIAPGDLICVIGSIDGSPAVTWDDVTVGPWTQVYEVNDPGDVTALFYCIKADGSEDGATLAIVTDVVQRSSWWSFIIPAAGWSGTIATGVFSGASITGGSSTDCNPPSLAPGIGALDFLWIAGAHADGNVTISTWSEASNQNESTNTNGAAALVAFSTVESNAETYDPGAYVLSGAEQNVRATIAIRPAAGGITASGAASIPSVTASGAATVHRAASGAAILTAIIATGIATVVHTASDGAPSLSPIESAGTAQIIKTASGSPSVPVVMASGAATVHREASDGVPTIPAIEAAGTATVAGAITASGAGILAPVEAAGIGLVVKTAAGSPSIPVLAASGGAIAHKQANGSPSISAINASGTAKIIKLASGAAQTPTIEASGAATMVRQASGAATVPAIVSTGSESAAKMLTVYSPAAALVIVMFVGLV